MLERGMSTVWSSSSRAAALSSEVSSILASAGTLMAAVSQNFDVAVGVANGSYKPL